MNISSETESAASGGKRRVAAREWRAQLAIAVVGLLVFESITGLSIYLLPFSITNQFAVLIHTVVGILMVAPYAWYQVRHILLARQTVLTNAKFFGIAAFVGLSLCVISGQINDRNFIKEGSFIFKAEGIDQYGNLIDRHNLWELVGARFRRSLFPGFSDAAEYRFVCPATIRLPGETLDMEQEHVISASTVSGGSLNVTARLRYRKIDQYLMNVMFGESSGLTTRVTDISSDSLTIRIR